MNRKSEALNKGFFESGKKCPKDYESGRCGAAHIVLEAMFILQAFFSKKYIFL
jgi:hypothetical protein